MYSGPMAKFLSPRSRERLEVRAQQEILFERYQEARDRKREAEEREAAAQEKRRRRGYPLTTQSVSSSATPSVSLVAEMEAEADSAEARAKAATKALATKVSDPFCDSLDSDDEEFQERARLQLKKKRILYEEEVKELITKPDADLTWEDMFGQLHAVDEVMLMVDAVNGNFDSMPHNAVLLCGPPGTGKDQLAMITACQVEGCTYFVIPEGFGSRKPLIWKVLFEMAVKMAPAVLFFNECEGVFTKGGSAVRALKNVKWDSSKEAPIIIGATNHPLEVDGAIQSRFGPSITFTSFDDDMRKEIVKRMKAPSDFASDDADWESLLPLLQGMQGRDIWQTCKTVAARVERECRNAQIDVRKITLADFQARLQTRAPAVEGMSPTAKQEVVDWIQMTFCEATEEQKKTFNSQKELVVPLFEDLLHTSLMPDDILLKLGTRDIKRIRTEKAEVHRDATFVQNLKSCFAVALPECEFMDLNCKTKQQLSRSETRDASGTVTGYAESEPGVVPGRRGFVIRNCRYRLSTTPTLVEMARTLGGCEAEVQKILERCPHSWDNQAIRDLFEWGANPEVVQFGKLYTYPNENPDLKAYPTKGFYCTFRHPSGAISDNVWTDSTAMNYWAYRNRKIYDLQVE